MDLRALRRSLDWANTCDEGLLWGHDWIGRSALAALKRAAGGVSDSPDETALLERLEAELLALDESDWTDRRPLLSGLLQLLEPWSQEPSAGPPTYVPVSQLLNPPLKTELVRSQPEEPSAEEPAERKSGPSEMRSAPWMISDLRGHEGPMADLLGLSEEEREALRSADITGLGELLERAPRGFEELSLTESDSLPTSVGEEVALEGVVVTCWRSFEGSAERQTLLLSVEGQSLRCEWSSPPCFPMPPSGERVCLVGQLELKAEKLILRDPLTWRAHKRRVLRPQYAVPEIADAKLRRWIRVGLHAVQGNLEDPLYPMLQELGLSSAFKALRALHVPQSSGPEIWRRPLMEALVRLQHPQGVTPPSRRRGMAHALGYSILGQVQLQHEYTLNDEQAKVLDAMQRELRRPWAMRRVLMGDSGSGKALLSYLIGILVSQRHVQVLYLTPDMPSARRRYLHAKPILTCAGLAPQLLSEELDTSQKSALRQGAFQFIFAPHSMALPRLPEMHQLGLVILEVDEDPGPICQETFQQKNHYPDVLVLPNLPLRWRSAFSTFPDFNLAFLEPSPFQGISSHLETLSYRSECHAELRRCVSEGGQGLIVLPSPGGKDLLSLEKLQAMGHALSGEVLDGARVEVYHSSMSPETLSVLHREFLLQRIKVLVCTAPIEEIPALPNLRILILEYADRIELERVHRLRALLRSSAHPTSLYLLLSQQAGEEEKEALREVLDTQNGFQLAERLGWGSKEELELPFPVCPDDMWPTIRLVRETLHKRLEGDPHFRSPAHRRLSRYFGWKVKDPPPRGRRRRRRSKR